MQLEAIFPQATPRSQAAAPDERGGCGWFNSSYELGHGLHVQEDTDKLLYRLWEPLLHRVFH